ncbi:hypothetical protein PDESU_02023 [Pontiella desulfatans]|jgi:hypothetical protein|uniref:Helix-turn-helix domain-containing protein n=1 Tax=Pontiella desulfatans TaxID=2750659 RepID=A0A6C2U255_PONDE|nr:helix-turn-helix domain-containing protein [Pontiella desulfatans]VGO13466.1 hypothetical protein PDESU_02023 [Pontiella desulfatans]
MKPATIELIKNVLSTDDTVLPTDAQKVLKQLAAVNGEQKPRPGTIKEAARILDVHPVTVRRYAKAGLLSTIRLSARKVRYNLNEVEHLAQAGID